MGSFRSPNDIPVYIDEAEELRDLFLYSKVCANCVYLERSKPDEPFVSFDCDSITINTNQMFRCRRLPPDSTGKFSKIIDVKGWCSLHSRRRD